MITIDHILKLTQFLSDYRKVERLVYIQNSERNENDVEHSYSLAMLAWYLNSALSLGLDQEKLFKYALAHDLVEVYAGDVYFYTTDMEVKNGKKQKEHDALVRIISEFPEFTELHSMIEAYEKREDEEAKFMYALDKLDPVLQIYIDKGRSWVRDKVDLKMLKEHKRDKIKVNKTVEEYYDQLLPYLEREEENLFPKL